MNRENNQIKRIEELRQYLQDRAAKTKKNYSKPEHKYSGFEELILDYGTVMEAKPFPKDLTPGLPKSCYLNCQQLAFQRKDLTYVEGYALAEDVPFPLPHAWLLTAEGYAIDPTWKTSNSCYLGIPFSTKWVKSVLAARKKIGRDNDLSIIECNYLEKFSLLKQGLLSDAKHQ